MRSGDDREELSKKQKITHYFRRSSSSINGAKAPETVITNPRTSENLPMGTTTNGKSMISQAELEELFADFSDDDILFEDNKSFIKLVDVVTDDNLIDLSKAHDTYALYQQPWTKDHVPIPLLSSDSFSNSFNTVKMPFQNDITIEHDGIEVKKWQLIQNLFSIPIDSLYKLEMAIKVYNPMLKNLEFDILRSYINHQIEEDDREYFFGNLLPVIIQLALDLPNLITCDLPTLDQGSTTALFLSQRQISSLLANGFLCTYTQRYKDDHRTLNFAKWYSTNSNEKRKGCKLEKIKCLLNYFRRVIQTVPTGTVSFERKQIESSIRPETSNNKVCKFDINSQQCMFQKGTDYAIVDFANKYIGGGVLNSGCVQEEIFFVICPELIVAKLFTEKLLSQDALIITGAEQFNEYANYADKFKWKGSFKDTLPRDKYGRKMRQIIAMDALYFHWKAIGSQYDHEKIDRELTKAMAAFQPERFLLSKSRLPAIATGNWGCGVFNGDPYLKTLIQIIAASVMNREIVYFAFNEEQLKKDFEKIKCILEKRPQLTVPQLYRITLEFAQQKQKERKLDLFSFLSRKLPQ